MDIWEANSVSAAYTPHPCSVSGPTRCTGSQCSIDNRTGGLCDPDGCDFNSFRMGDKSFYGKGLKVDTSKKFTVVTQFLTNDNTTTGTLSEIRRLYVQDGKVIQNSKVNIPGMAVTDSITDNFCAAQKTTFGDTNTFKNNGGLAAMGKSFKNGVVLVLSIWDDHAAQMLWLDSNFPTTADATKPGIARGTCATTSGVPTDIEASIPNSSVTFSNIKFGDIGSTYSGGTTTTTTTTTTTSTSTSTAPAATQTKYGQW
jgi:cellulose 1,4-beta-cellobiosidase